MPNLLEANMPYIRTTEYSLETYDRLSNEYRRELLSLLENSSEFRAVVESKDSYIMPKKDLYDEASKLAKDSNVAISNFGKAVLKFLASGAKGFDDLCIAIGVVLIAGGATLSTCITLIIGIILFAITVLPFTVLVSGLAKIDKSLGNYINKNSNDKNFQKYVKLSKNIQSQKDGIKDIRDLEKIVKVSESLDDIIDYPGIVSLAEATEVKKFTDLTEALRAINHKVSILESSKFDVFTMKSDINSDLAPSNLIATSSIVSESTKLDDSTMEKLFGENRGLYIMEQVNSGKLLSRSSLEAGILTIATESTGRLEYSTKAFLEKYRDTVKYELTHESYSDLPIMRVTNNYLSIIREGYSDVPSVLEVCDALDYKMGEIIDECMDEVKEDGFNPDPFNLGSLTPLPVASRKVGDALCDVYGAEDDDEITEVMLNLGRISNIIRENYYVDILEDGTNMIIQEDAGKIAREVETKSTQNMSKITTRDKTGGVKYAVKKTIDPMEKFIEKQYAILKEKDAEERRKVIISGGSVPKVMRWIKRSIGLLIGSAVGAVVPAAAIVTGITFIGFIATDKYLDQKERAKIMKELDDEIMICNEKIDDSRGDDNKQKKYELMRIRNNLQRTRDKIHYGLKN